MTTPERSRAYLQLDSDRLSATTPVEFRQLLDHIRMRAGLTPSQIAVKTAIPRSQAYNMVAANRTTLPSKPRQVREFVEACGLAPVQVGLVMSLWSKLDQQTRERAAEHALSLIDGGTASDTNRHEQIMKILDSAPIATNNRGPMIRGDRPTYRRNRAGSDLLYLVLDSQERTRRALLLLIPVAIAFVAIVASFVVWAILQPDHAPWIAGILAGAVLLPIMSCLRRPQRE